MLQHVLKDMHIDPQLLAGLEEIEKETLFCCMREEQLRRWKIWDQEETEAMQNRPPRAPRLGMKTVKWILDESGEPVVDVIDSLSEEDVQDSNGEVCEKHEEYEQKELRVTINESHCADICSIEPVADTLSKYVNVARINNKNSISTASVVLNFSEKRGALQELSLNKVPRVASQVAEWEKRVVQDEANGSSLNNKISLTCPPIKKINESTSANELQEEQLWREQQKKAKETEIRMRAIARIARDNHRRSLIENENIVITDSSIIDEIKKEVIKQPNNEAVLNWYKSKELPKNAGLDCNKKFADWFHGLVSRKEAEDLLSDEKEGTFLVRISEHLWTYTISCKTSLEIKHYLIDAPSNGNYQLLRGSNQIKHFSLGDLISYHQLNSLVSNEKEFLLHPCARKRNVPIGLLDQS